MQCRDLFCNRLGQTEDFVAGRCHNVNAGPVPPVTSESVHSYIHAYICAYMNLKSLEICTEEKSKLVMASIHLRKHRRLFCSSITVDFSGIGYLDME